MHFERLENPEEVVRRNDLKGGIKESACMYKYTISVHGIAERSICNCGSQIIGCRRARCASSRVQSTRKTIVNEKLILLYRKDV